MHTDQHMAYHGERFNIQSPSQAINPTTSASPAYISPPSSISSSSLSSKSATPSALTNIQPASTHVPQASVVITNYRGNIGRSFHDGRDCLFGISSCPGCKYSDWSLSARVDDDDDNNNNTEIRHQPNNSNLFDQGNLNSHHGTPRHHQHRHPPLEVRAHRQYFFETILGLDVATAIQSPAANRAQLLASFVNDMTWIESIADRHQHMIAVHDWFHSTHPLVAVATDSVLITHFADLTQDDRFQDEVRRTQAAAVASLQVALQRPNAAQNDAILAATDALGIRQMYYKGTSPRLAYNMAKLLTAAGFLHLERRADAQPDLIFSVAHTIVTAGLINRRTCLFSDPRWYGVLEEKCRGRIWCLVHLQARIPHLLDTVDNATQMSRAQANNLFAQLIAIDRLLHQWLLTWYSELKGEIIWTTSITNLQRFIAEYGPVVEAFPRVFQFRSLAVALGHLYYWITTYWVRQALWMLVTKHSAVFPEAPDPVAWSLTRVNECVDSLCRTIPFILEQPQSANPGMLRLACKWYQRTGEMTKVAFCEAILNKAVMASFQFETQRNPSDKYYIGANSFIFRRIIWNRIVGPSKCCLRHSERP